MLWWICAFFMSFEVIKNSNIMELKLNEINVRELHANEVLKIEGGGSERKDEKLNNFWKWLKTGLLG